MKVYVYSGQLAPDLSDIIIIILIIRQLDFYLEIVKRFTLKNICLVAHVNNFAGCDFNFEGKLVGCEGKGEGGADPIGGGVGNIGSKTSTQCSKHCSTMFKTLFDIVQNINKLFNIDADSVEY